MWGLVPLPALCKTFAGRDLRAGICSEFLTIQRIRTQDEWQRKRIGQPGSFKTPRCRIQPAGLLQHPEGEFEPRIFRRQRDSEQQNAT